MTEEAAPVRCAPALRSIALIVLLLATTCAGKAFADAPPVSIGVSLPLTGPASTYGEDLRNAYVFANQMMAEDRFQLIFEDDRCDPKTGVTVAQKFGALNKVKIVIGVPCDGVFAAAAPIYEQYGITVISTSARSVPGQRLFHTNLDVATWPGYLLEYLKTRHSRVGVLTEQTEFAMGFSSGFSSRATENNIQVTNELFVSGTDDFRPLLLRLQSSKPTGLLFLTQTESSLLRIVQQAHQLGITLPEFNVFFAGSPTFIAAAGAAAEGMTFLSFPSLEDSLLPDSREIYARYRKQYGVPGSGEAMFVQGFEGFRAAQLAMSQGEDPSLILKTARFAGVEGDWQFDSHGFWAGPKMVIRQLRGGRVVSP